MISESSNLSPVFSCELTESSTSKLCSPQYLSRMILSGAHPMTTFCPIERSDVTRHLDEKNVDEKTLLSVSDRQKCLKSLCPMKRDRMSRVDILGVGLRLT